ncbi:MAG TPA: hypothetical protein DCQ97_12110 [Chitinophagaceae bacterium]|nr:hypothetical protein [Chitinophagaceae bacterium]
MIVQEKMNPESKDIPLLFDTCAYIWQKLDNKPAIRYVTIRILVKIARDYPGLANESRLLADSIYTKPLSKAARKSISRLVQELSCNRVVQADRQCQCP